MLYGKLKLKVYFNAKTMLKQTIISFSRVLYDI